MPRILITGFAPFLGEKINPSQLLLQECKSSVTPAMAGVDTLLLPVSYADAFGVLKKHLENQPEKYSHVVMLGQASGRGKISLERVAVNWQESLHADEDGYVPNPGAKIDDSAPNAFFSGLPLEKIKTALEKAQIPVEISFSAGAFVCNAVFFQAAFYLENENIPNGFIHVPLLPEQGTMKPGVPTMPLSQMHQALEVIISCLQ